MIKNIKIINHLLLGTVLNAQIIDAKQLFNKKNSKSKKEELSLIKVLWNNKIDESH